MKNRKNYLKSSYCGAKRPISFAICSKFPKASEMARIRIYEYNFKNKEMFGHKQEGTWMIKNPDGKEVEICICPMYIMIIVVFHLNTMQQSFPRIHKIEL